MQVVPGQRFGVYTVIDECVERYMRQKTFDVRCDCGNVRRVRLGALIKLPSYCSQCRPTKTLVVGQRFTRLVITNPMSGRKKGIRFAEAMCDCGRVVEKKIGYLMNGNAKSCGCLARETGPKHRDWAGCGEISGEYFSRIRLTARKQGREWAVSVDQLWDLFIKQDRKCSLSGLVLHFDDRGAGIKGTASLDRIDSSRGYTLDNVQWTHKHVNVMKNRHGVEYFVSLCKAVADLSSIRSARLVDTEG